MKMITSHRSVSIVSLCAIGLAVGSPSAGAALQTPYHILVTNDDGIESPGIQALAEALGEVGDVTVIAPCGERSGSGMSIALGAPIRLRPVERDGRSLGRCVDATPAGSVLFALTAMAPESGFDLVVSGINRGANVGDVSHMSGTVGAAMTGAYAGVPAIAASLGETDAGFDYAARFVAGFVRELQAREPAPGIVFSINLPKGTAAETRGVAVRRMGGSYLRLEYEEVPAGDGERLFRPRFVSPRPYPPGSDSEAYSEGFVTITPLAFDWSALDLIESLEGWNLETEAEAPR